MTRPAFSHFLICAAWTALAVFTTFLIHEFGHWAAGEMLGENMVMTLNAAYPESKAYNNPDYRQLITAAGPAVTLAQAFLVFLVMGRLASGAGSIDRWLPFLAVPMVMRAMAGVINVVNTNDEGRLSQAMGLGTYTLPLLVTALLAVLWARTCRQHSITGRQQTGWIFGAVFFASVLVLGDQALDYTLIPWSIS